MGHTRERQPRFLAAADLDAEFLFQRHHQLERIDRIEVQSGADEWLVIGHLCRRDVLELERRDDEMLEPGDERIVHKKEAERKKRPGWRQARGTYLEGSAPVL